MRLIGYPSLAALALLAFVASVGAEPVKIGVITTLSGPSGYLGEDTRDGFLLATKAMPENLAKCRSSS